VSVVQTIKVFAQQGGMGDVPPTIEEMAAALDVSPSTARNRLDRLVADGMLTKTKGKARGYTMTLAAKRIMMAGQR